MSTIEGVKRALQIANDVLKLVPEATSVVEDVVGLFRGKTRSEQQGLAQDLAVEIRRRRRAADEAIEFIRKGPAE